MIQPDRLSDPEVLISGAGPTGLMLALWLTKLGVRVRIVELRSGPVQETRAIAVQARTLEFYDQLGLSADALKRGRPFSGFNLFVASQRRGAVSLHGVGDDHTPYPYLYTLTQDQNEALLVEHLAALGVAVEWQTRLTGCTQDGQGITATLERAEQTAERRTETVHAQYIAACDGAGSTVRHALKIPLSGGTYDERFYVADVDLEGKVPTGEVSVVLDTSQFLAFFPMVEAGRMRVVGSVPAALGEEVAFEAVRPEIEAGGLAHITNLHWFSTYRVHHRVADHFQQGRAFILGDAGHVHTPVGGQGMNTGLGDATNLAWKLAQALRGAPATLATYEAERRPFALSLVHTTDRVFTAVVSSAPLALWLRLHLIPRIVPILTRLSVVRRLLFLTVSQTRLHYPHSPLSVGRAGKLRGGMRLPWVRSAAGSNFDALKTLRWQVHVYGVPSPALLSWCGRQGVALHVFAFGAVARRAGLLEDAAYLVRPDGYIGLAAPQFEQASFDAYAQRWLPA
ncbi:FAD-dependent monooxygenase [Deinococcus ruber]|uniref:2-polyprenyl-6-methoxyphenol hydroxylase n=1 Tax=Deinococcus ruber TaxID=1848197 RepID=A0A918CP40_9DEIO|nr:FAD-dependent monooxygenase [Deinococcus ruber]GGR34419.1 2-polyprenyl-6-methoxyphenol hydroxylase [Deinococcus ruber]